jgi:ABC-type uncharacterized transport system fused permease/ATPase subunit
MFEPGMTLLQVILYPHTPNAIADTAALPYIKTLMGKLNLSHKIDDLEKPGENWETALSAGEKQRIALISAIVKKPKVLFMDETTSNLDPENKAIAERVLREELPDTIILYTDHNPSQESKPVQPYLPSTVPATAAPKAFRDQTICLPKLVNAPRLAG